MGLFSKEACVFCGTEVGMLKRSKLQTKEYICNECKRKTNPFARMDYTSKDDAQRMMDTLAQEAAEFEGALIHGIWAAIEYSTVAIQDLVLFRLFPKITAAMNTFLCFILIQ